MGLVSASFPKEGPTTVLAGGQKVGRLVWDDFDRPNASTLGNAATGQGWVADAGSWGITGSKASLTAPILEGRLRLDSGRSDGRISVLLRTASARPGTGGKETLMMFRHKDDSNFFQVGIKLGTAPTNDRFEIVKQVAGSWSALASVSMALSSATDYQVECSYLGSLIKASLNGVERISLTDTDLNPERGVGLRCYNSDADNTLCWDNIGVRPL